MAIELTPIKYVDYKVGNVIKIKEKLGFRIELILENGNIKKTQHSGFTDRKVAEKERYKIIAQLENGTYIVYSDVSVKTYMEYWYENILPSRLNAEGSFGAYRNAVFNHIIPRIGKIKLVELKKGHIKKLYEQVYEYSKSSAGMVKTVMNASLNDALIKNFVATNVAENEKLPSDNKGKTKEQIKEEYEKSYHTLVIDERKTYTVEQIITLIKASKDTPIYLQILFASLMGLRKSEINGIKYSDIDYLHRKLYLQRQLGKKIGIKKEDVAPKTFTKQEVGLKTRSSYRVLDIPDFVFEAILEQRKKYEANRKRRINDRTYPFQDLDFVCCSTYGRPRSRGYIFQHFRRIKEETGLPDLPFHKLRTTYTTILAKNDFSMKAISKLLGHSSEMITFENYTDKNEIIVDCLEELEPYIEKIIPKEYDEVQIVDCTDIITDEIMQNVFEKLIA